MRTPMTLVLALAISACDPLAVNRNDCNDDTGYTDTDQVVAAVEALEVALNSAH